jgi:hypothetical protein
MKTQGDSSQQKGLDHWLYDSAQHEK